MEITEDAVNEGRAILPIPRHDLDQCPKLDPDSPFKLEFQIYLLSLLSRSSL